MKFKAIHFVVFCVLSINGWGVGAHSSDEDFGGILTNSELFELAQDLVVEEKGTRLWVPRDYGLPDGAKVPLYFSRPFGWDPSLPSVILFGGGPGETIHGLLDRYRRLAIDGYNIIFFDIRGSGFSISDNPEDQKFYSSLTTARDADEIRKFLGIQKWSVMGGSYGSIPATIYASLYPNQTRATVLAGSHFLDPHGENFESLRLRKFEELFAKMTLPTRLRHRSFIRYRVESQLTADGTIGLLTFIEKLDKRRSSEILRARRPTILDRLQQNDLVSFYYRREIMAPPGRRLSSASYPILGPVTYIHGTHDPRTPMEGMELHYEHVARGFRQKLILSDMGHFTLSLLPPTLLAHVLSGLPLEDYPGHRCVELLLAKGK